MEKAPFSPSATDSGKVPNRLQAAIFDMDGLLVDTEWLWQEAEKEVFARVGITLTTEMCLETMGLRIDEVVMHWFRRFPWEALSVKEIEAAVLEKVAALIVEKGKLLPGVVRAIGLMREAGLRLAVASSSANMLIETVLTHFQLKPFFELYASAEDEELGKPHPAVFLRAAAKLGVPATACVALEDSFNGLLSAKSARMKTIVVPEPAQLEDPRWVIADLKLGSLGELDLEKILQLGR